MTKDTKKDIKKNIKKDITTNTITSNTEEIKIPKKRGRKKKNPKRRY